MVKSYGALQATYRQGRGVSEDSYRVGALGSYRVNREVPTQFAHGTAMCGAVVVWTRGG